MQATPLENAKKNGLFMTKEFLDVDIYIKSKVQTHIELPNCENLQVSQLICTPLNLFILGFAMLLMKNFNIISS